MLCEINEKYVNEARVYHKVKKTLWLKWEAMAACFAVALSIGVFRFWRDSNTAVSISSDIAPMVYVNDTLYKQSPEQTGFDEMQDDFVYLGEIQSVVSYEGEPKENFQANDPIIGAEIYQYGDDIVVLINGQYWLYEKYEKVEANLDDLSEEEKDEIDPYYRRQN